MIQFKFVYKFYRLSFCLNSTHNTTSAYTAYISKLRSENRKKSLEEKEKKSICKTRKHWEVFFLIFKSKNNQQVISDKKRVNFSSIISKPKRT